MTKVECQEKLAAIKKAGVSITATATPLKEAEIHISLDTEKGGIILYNSLFSPLEEWIERVYNAMKAVGLIN